MNALSGVAERLAQFLLSEDGGTWEDATDEFQGVYRGHARNVLAFVTPMLVPTEHVHCLGCVEAGMVDCVGVVGFETPVVIDLELFQESEEQE